MESNKLREPIDGFPFKNVALDFCLGYAFSPRAHGIVEQVVSFGVCWQ